MNEERLLEILQDEENYHLELKAARSTFSRAKVNDYCAAIANEDGGYLILGVDNNKTVVGSAAFPNWNELAGQITNELQIRVKVYPVVTTSGRVLIFEVPRHDLAKPVRATGGTRTYTYPIRNGESMNEMSPTALQGVFAERDEDWSSETIEGLTSADLDESALSEFRNKWAESTAQSEHNRVSFDQMLTDLQLTLDGQITKAAVLLLGKEATVTRAIPDAEIILEWRNDEHDIAYGDRKSWRAGFMLVEEEIWEAINARNTHYRYQEGFVQRDMASYDEETIREAVINAFAHRDYRIQGRSIVIKISPEHFYIENPGRLMPGVTLDNIFDRSAWRNRRLAESLEKVRLMERSSQGIDKIFRRTIEAGKGLPTIVLSHDPAVSLTIPAQLADQKFIQYLEKISNERQISLTVKEIIELERIRQGQIVSDVAYREKFLELGIIERVGYGRGSRYILSGHYYQDSNAAGEHTRLSGLPREVKKQLIIEHLKKHGKVTNAELQVAMPGTSSAAITGLLKGMGSEGVIVHEGSRKSGYWRAVGSE